MSDEVILKTSFMGFNKQEVMDYIETLQKENRELKKRIAQLEGRPEPVEEVEPQPEAAQPETPAEAPEELPKISNVNLQNPLEDDSDEEVPVEEAPDAGEPSEEEMEPDVAAAINKADEAIAEADKSIVLNDDKYDDAVTAIYNAVMEAVSHSEEIQLELDHGKSDGEKEEDTEPEASKPKAPVKVKVKIRPKKDE